MLIVVFFERVFRKAKHGAFRKGSRYEVEWSSQEEEDGVSPSRERQQNVAWRLRARGPHTQHSEVLDAVSVSVHQHRLFSLEVHLVIPQILQ